MSDPSLEMQAAIIAALKENGALPAAVGGRVYEVPPPKPVFPYVTLGPTQVLPDKADCIDGAEVFQQVDVWSRQVGSPEAKEVSKAIVVRLDDQPLNVLGHNVIVFEHQGTRHLRDSDGVTSHSAITFRFLAFPT